MPKITYFCAYQYLKLENIFVISNPKIKKYEFTHLRTVMSHRFITEWQVESRMEEEERYLWPHRYNVYIIRGNKALLNDWAPTAYGQKREE